MYGKRCKPKATNNSVDKSPEIEVVHQVITRSNKSKTNQSYHLSNNNKMIIRTLSTSVSTIPETNLKLDAKISNNILEENCIPSTSNFNNNKSSEITVLKVLKKKLSSEIDLNYLKKIIRKFFKYF